MLGEVVLPAYDTVALLALYSGATSATDVARPRIASTSALVSCRTFCCRPPREKPKLVPAVTVSRLEPSDCELADHLRLGALAHRHQRDHRADPDHDAEHGEEGAHLVHDQRLRGHAQDHEPFSHVCRPSQRPPPNGMPMKLRRPRRGSCVVVGLRGGHLDHDLVAVVQPAHDLRVAPVAQPDLHRHRLRLPRRVRRVRHQHLVHPVRLLQRHRRHQQRILRLPRPRSSRWPSSPPAAAASPPPPARSAPRTPSRRPAASPAAALAPPAPAASARARHRSVICAGCPALTRRIVVSSTDASTCSSFRFASVRIVVFAADHVAHRRVRLQHRAVERRGQLACRPAPPPHPPPPAASCPRPPAPPPASRHPAPSSSFARASFAVASATSASFTANCAFASASAALAEALAPACASAKASCASARVCCAFRTCICAFKSVDLGLDLGRDTGIHGVHHLVVCHLQPVLVEGIGVGLRWPAGRARPSTAASVSRSFVN